MAAAFTLPLSAALICDLAFLVPKASPRSLRRARYSAWAAALPEADNGSVLSRLARWDMRYSGAGVSVKVFVSGSYSPGRYLHRCQNYET